MERAFATLGAILAGLGVAAGAFGAHALRARLEPRALEIFETAVRYQLVHALALFAVAWGIGCHRRLGTLAGWLLLGGLVADMAAASLLRASN